MVCTCHMIWYFWWIHTIKVSKICPSTFRATVFIYKQTQSSIKAASVILLFYLPCVQSHDRSSRVKGSIVSNSSVRSCERPQMTRSCWFPYVTPMSNQLTNKRWVKSLRKSLLFRRSWPWKRPACLLSTSDYRSSVCAFCARSRFCEFALIPSSAKALVGHASSLVQYAKSPV